MSTFILPFEKMQGLGNDFVMLHYKHLPPDINELELAKQLCNRNFGIGADGIIIAKPPVSGGDFGWEYINSDGSYGEMCGNGMRCFAKYIFDRGMSKDNIFSVETRAGMIIPIVEAHNMVTVDMGTPIIDSNITISITSNISRDFARISMGNPHAIHFFSSIQEVNNIDLTIEGAFVETYQAFPNKTNVEFACIDQDNLSIYLKVWERGAGYTLACGTGACATVVAAINQNYLPKDQEIKVILPGGDLFIKWNSDNNHVFMTGPAISVFVGQYEFNI